MKALYLAVVILVAQPLAVNAAEETHGVLIDRGANRSFGGRTTPPPAAKTDQKPGVKVDPAAKTDSASDKNQAAQGDDSDNNTDKPAAKKHKETYRETGNRLDRSAQNYYRVKHNNGDHVDTHVVN